MKRRTAGLLTLFLLYFPAQGEERTPVNTSNAKVSYVSGSIFVRQSEQIDFNECVVNTFIDAGDRLETRDGRAEIAVSGGLFLRLDKQTQIDILKLADKTDALVKLKIWTGNLYVRVKTIRKEKSIEIQTPDISIYLLEKGLYRFDTRENQETEIFVFSGLLEASLDNGSELVKDEQRLETVKGRPTSGLSGFPSLREDSFDLWNGQRDYAVGGNLNRNKVYPPSPDVRSHKTQKSPLRLNRGVKKKK
ncbi:FecR domain-containing protein [Acidobacteriota bacterium]